MLRALFCVGCGLCFAVARGGAAEAPLLVLKSDTFVVAIDRSNGSVARISHPQDPAGMNWITSAQDTPWQPRSLQWGLGYANIGPGTLHRARWELPESVSNDERSVKVVYHVGALRVDVSRELEPDAFSETYVFTNVGPEPVPLTHWAPGAFAIAAPWNDNYTTAEDCLEHRSHAHLWCGGSTSWICGLRMGGRPPHLGLVLTKGALEGYSIAGRDAVTSSNTRGIFLLHPKAQTLAPGASLTVGWRLFWHQGWDDFFAQVARRSPRAVRITASRYSLTAGEPVELTVESPAELVKPVLTVGGRPVPLKPDGQSLRATVRPTNPGPLTCTLVAAGDIETRLELNVLPPLEELVSARVRFIVSRQQVNAPGDLLDGAFLVYDNERDAQVRREWGHDHNEARERLGMGVLLARWLRLQSKKDPAIVASLERYYKFVSEQLQQPDGTVLNGVGDDEKRLYNWPWVMQLHLEMALLTGDNVPLRRFVRTVEKFYDAGGGQIYPIGVPVLEGLQAVKDVGWKNDYDHLRAFFSKHAATIEERGLKYPAHEVNFEQSIVAPAAIFLLELHRATGDERWLEAARPHLACLELFGGRQPDHRLHEIAIRHWDGYWFGKSRMWGDTFPHYWSTLTALAFSHYAAATDDRSYEERAQAIVRGNLSLFATGGRASCAYLYPTTINGEPGKFADAYANDQDWALVHALMVLHPAP